MLLRLSLKSSGNKVDLHPLPRERSLRDQNVELIVIRGFADE
jgi:hypothetical protein